VSQYVVTIVIAAVVLVFIVYQQMRSRPIQSRQLIVIPVILALLGIANLQKHPPDSTAAAVALAASVITAITFGVGRGMTLQIWRAKAVSMRKGTGATLALWVTGLALRIVIGIVADRSGVPTSVTTGELPLFLGITLAAQNVVIWLRGQDAATR
jgi:hypothetical protein